MSILNPRPQLKAEPHKHMLDTKEANECLLYTLARIRGRLHRLPDSPEKEAIRKEICLAFQKVKYE